MYDTSILIIEDDVGSIKALELLLYGIKHNTIIVTTGEEGLEYLSKHKNVVLILLDVMLPEMSGLEFLSIAKADPGLKNIPIILQSAVDERDLQRGKGTSADGCLEKPYTRERLLALINRIKKREGAMEYP